MGVAPCSKHLGEFWCLGYFLDLNPAHKRTKLEPRRRPCRLLSYCFDKRAYNLLDLDRDKIGPPVYDVVWTKNPSSHRLPPGKLLDHDPPPAPTDYDEADIVTCMREPDLALSATEMAKCDEAVDEKYASRYEAANNAVIGLSEAMADTVNRENWLGGIKTECRAVDQSWVWKKLPTGHRALPCRIILTRKDDGRFKARIVAIGFLQYVKPDEGTTYAPTLMADSFRAAVAICAKMGYDLEGADVSTAFLLADIPEGEANYVCSPKGWIPRNKDDEEKMRGVYVWRLIRALYGLRKSPKHWGDHFHRTAVQEFNCIQFQSDRCVYIWVAKCGSITIALVFVDDLVVAGKHAKFVKSMVLAKFPCRDLGRLKDFLGCQILYQDQSIILSLERYVEKFIRKFQVSEKGVATPLERKLVFDGKLAPPDNSMR